MSLLDLPAPAPVIGARVVSRDDPLSPAELAAERKRKRETKKKARWRAKYPEKAREAARRQWARRKNAAA